MIRRMWTARDGSCWDLEEGTNEILVAGGPPPPLSEISPVLRFFEINPVLRFSVLFSGDLNQLGDDELEALLARARDTGGAS